MGVDQCLFILSGFGGKVPREIIVPIIGLVIFAIGAWFAFPFDLQLRDRN